MKRGKGYGLGVRNVDDEYSHLDIKFCAKYNNQYEWVGRIMYQTSNSSDTLYGGTLDLMGFGDKLFYLKYFYKIIEDIKKNVGGWGYNIEELLEYIKENYRRYIYDNREMDIIRIDKVKSFKYSRYMAWHNSQCLDAVIEEDINKAKKKLKNKAKKHIENKDYKYEEYENWLENGRKVVLDTFNNMDEDDVIKISDINKMLNVNLNL